MGGEQVLANDVVIDFGRNVLSGPLCAEYRIEPRPMHVVRLLLAHEGRAISRAGIIDAIWPGRHGADQSLTNAISTLRKAFGACSADPPQIETVPKTGYALHAKISKIADETVPQMAEPPPPAGWRRGKTVFLAAGLTGAFILALVAVLVWGGLEERPANLVESENTLAVLPFYDAAFESGRSPFGDSFAEAVLNELGQSDDLFVTSHASSSQFPAQLDADRLQNAARRLGVSHILLGALQRKKETVLATVRLYDALENDTVWTLSFQEPFEELYALERRIAEETAAQLHVALPPAGKRRRPPPPSVFDAYLEARALTSTRRVDDVQAARNLLEWATRADPLFADGWAQYAYTLQVLQTLSSVASERGGEAEPGIQQAAKQALKLEPDNILALTAKAISAMETGNFEEAERNFRQIIDINPNAGEAFNWYGDLLGMLDRSAGQIEAEEKAARLDPLLVSNHYNLALAYARVGQDQQAIEAIDNALEIDPTHPISLELKLMILHGSGKEQPLKDFDRHIRGLALSERDPVGVNRKQYLEILASTFIADLKGETSPFAQRLMEGSLDAAPAPLTPMLAALILSRIGEYDAAAKWLEAANEAPFLLYNPYYFPTDADILNAHPAYGAFWNKPPQSRVLHIRNQQAR